MVIYEVNQEMDSSVFPAFKKWFIETHIDEMLANKGFLEAKFVLQQDNSGGKTRTTCFYLLDSQENLDEFLKQNVVPMTQRLTDQFGDKVQLRKRNAEVLCTVRSPRYKAE